MFSFNDRLTYPILQVVTKCCCCCAFCGNKNKNSPNLFKYDKTDSNNVTLQSQNASYPPSKFKNKITKPMPKKNTQTSEDAMSEIITNNTSNNNQNNQNSQNNNENKENKNNDNNNDNNDNSNNENNNQTMQTQQQQSQQSNQQQSLETSKNKPTAV